MAARRPATFVEEPPARGNGTTRHIRPVDAHDGSPLAPGLHDLGPGGVALVAEMPFGRGDAALLDAVADWAERFGDGTVRLTPTRGFVLPRLTQPARVRDAASARGLIVAADDPRRRVAACPGAPACASGHAPAQADAATLAPALPPGLRLHVSGCAKGCAHPGPTALTLVAEPGGLYGLVSGGTARDAPVAHLTLAAVRDRLAVPPGAKFLPAPAKTA